MSTSDKTAQRLLAEHGQRRAAPRLPPIDELAALARDYLALVVPSSGIGIVYVTLAAAETYAAHEAIQIEEARRELTELLLDARRVPGAPSEPTELWRFRRRSSGVDVSARVSREHRLAVVVSINVRTLNAGGARP